MLRRLTTLTNLPMPLKMGIFVLAGGGLAGGLYMARNMLSGRLLWFLLIAGLVVVLIVGLVKGLAKWRQKRRAKQFDEDLGEQAKSTPQGVKKAERIASLEELRRKFQEGVQTLRSHGKDPYFLPWYVIIGEPGAGKTEAIRHSNLDFPPDLNDEFQGVGGTINMNWWFTNHAIILDTAGRLVFEEVEAGGSGEWKEFLRLIRRHRRNCPINGLILAIPADSLITDSIDQINEKANKLSRQLGVIQSALGDLRFPVFVVITKSDLINGFREFTEKVQGPNIEYQMLGWSNPQPLDERFDPNMLDEHLEQLMDRIRSRTLGMLLDPVPEDPSKRRADEVDSSFAFPESLDRLVPRLRTYLEKTFVAASGVWAGKPLFLRGIYFTSSMREGAALDAELAEALDVPVESLPEGRVWEREKSFFLHDVFTRKVFKEQGLVTWASSARKQHRRRKGLVMGAGIVTVLVLIGLTILGAGGFRQHVGEHRDAWMSARKMLEKQPIIAAKAEAGDIYPYYGQKEAPAPRDTLTRVELLGRLRELCGQEIKVPAIFALAAALRSESLSQKNRARTYAELLERSVVGPLALGAAEKMSGAADRPWSPAATDALVELVRLRGYSRKLQPATAPEQPAEGEPDVPQLKPLFFYVFNENQRELAAEDVTALQEDLNWVYTGAEHTTCVTPDRVVEQEPFSDNSLLRNGLAAFIRSLKSADGADSIYECAEQLIQIAAQFSGLGDSEAELLTSLTAAQDRGLPEDSAAFQALRTQWEEKYGALREKGQALDELIAAAPCLAETGDITLAYHRARNDLKGRVQAFFGRLPGSGGAGEPWREDLAEETLEAHKGFAGELQAMEAAIIELLETAWAEGDVAGLPERIRTAALQVSAPEAGEAAEEGGESEAAEEPEEAVSTIAATPFEERLGTVQQEFLAPVSLADSGLSGEGAGDLGDAPWLYRARLFIYSRADRGLGDAGEADISPLRLPALLKSMEDDFKEAVAAMGALESVAADAYRVGEATDCGRFVLRASHRMRRSELARRMLEDAPATVEEFQQAVADLVAEGGIAPLDVPELPLTQLKEDGFAPELHPDAGRALLQAWSALGQRIRDPEEELLDKDELEQQYASVATTAQEYARRYLEYWTDTVPNTAMLPRAASWSQFGDALEAADHKVMNDVLMSVCKTVIRALDCDAESCRFAHDLLEKDDALRRQYDGIHRMAVDALEPLRAESEFASACGDLLQGWQGLTGQDAARARVRVLNLRPTGFMEEYAVKAASGRGEDLAFHYWEGLALEGVSSLAREAGQAVRPDLLRIKANLRFPLAVPPGDPDDDLTTAEIALVRQAVERILPAPVPETIGAGLRVGSDEIDRRLDNLRWPEVFDREDRELLDRVSAVLSALPEDEPLKCVVILPSEQETTTVGFWRVIALNNEKPYATSMPEAQELGTVEVPGTFQLELFRYPADAPDQPDKRIMPGSQWGAVRLLHEGAADEPGRGGQRHVWSASPHQGGKVWTVELEVQRMAFQQETLPLKLKLEFERPFPDPDKWPRRSP